MAGVERGEPMPTDEKCRTVAGAGCRHADRGGVPAAGPERWRGDGNQSSKAPRAAAAGGLEALIGDVAAV
jgi:hypothetical protein